MYADELDLHIGLTHTSLNEIINNTDKVIADHLILGADVVGLGYPHGYVNTTTGNAPGTNRFEVTGDKGRLIYDKGSLVFDKLEAPISEHIKTAENGFAMPNRERIEIKVEEDNPQHVGILNNFANAVLGLEELYAKAEEGIKGVTLANAMHLSTWTNDTVEIPFDGKKFYELLQEKIQNSARGNKQVIKTEATDLSSTYNN